MIEMNKVEDDRVMSATMKQMLDPYLILTNERGDELWRYQDGDDGKPRWKVWAVERQHQTRIKNLLYVKEGATYFDTGLISKRSGVTYLGSDYIIPRKYLKTVARMLGLNLTKDKPHPLSEKQKIAHQKLGERSRAAAEARRSRAA